MKNYEAELITNHKNRRAAVSYLWRKGREREEKALMIFGIIALLILALI